MFTSFVVFQNRRHHSDFEFDFLHDQMVSLEIIFFVMASISVCFGLYTPEENLELLVESQALAEMAKALPRLQSYQGRNNYKMTYYEICTISSILVELRNKIFS